MKLYHGSAVGGIKELEPFLSEHGKPYIYFSSNPAVALLYAVKPVPKPFSYYPYGFDENGTVVYSEYWENSFYELYKGKSGFLYECDVTDAENPTAISSAYTCELPINTNYCIEVDDLYNKFTEFKNEGLFEIKAFDTISENELNFVYDDMRRTILQNNLYLFSQNPMSKFIKEHFAKVWNNQRYGII